MEKLLWHAGMIPGALMHYWPLLLIALMVFGVGLYQWLQQSPKPTLDILRLFTVLAITLGIMLLGVIFAIEPSSQPLNSLPPWSYVIFALIFIQFLVSVYLTWSSQANVRMLKAGLLLIMLVLSFAASFIAMMSMSGDWL